MKNFEVIKHEVENNPNAYHEGTLEILNSIKDKETQNNIAGFISENNWGYGNDHWSTSLVNNTKDWI